MGPLFWRIFAALWAGSTLLMFGTAAVVALRAEANRPDIVRDQFAPMIEAVAAGALASEGDSGLQALQVLKTINGTEIYLVDPLGQERYGRSLPSFNASTPAQNPPTGAVRMPIEGTVSDGDGTTYLIVATLSLPEPPSARTLAARLIEPMLGSVLLAGLISALVARYLVSPLAKLRAATSRLGEGDLDYRIGGALKSRRDEFADLATDFDRMAERISQLVHSQRRLLLDLSHELRSPLTRLRVALELSGDPAQPRQALLARMERDVERMDVLIGELLLLARIEWTGARREFTTVDVGELAGEIVDDARLEAVNTGHQLDYHGADVPLCVRGDQELLRRAIENIVRNALQHTPAGTNIKVTVSASAAEVCVSVRDSGSGIPDESIEKLFVPFARGVDPSSNGHGLGLAISRGAIHQHGGRIETRMAPDGAGFVVSICLPLSA